MPNMQRKPRKSLRTSHKKPRLGLGHQQKIQAHNLRKKEPIPSHPGQTHNPSLKMRKMQNRHHRLRALLEKPRDRIITPNTAQHERHIILTSPRAPNATMRHLQPQSITPQPTPPRTKRTHNQVLLTLRGIVSIGFPFWFLVRASHNNSRKLIVASVDECVTSHKSFYASPLVAMPMATFLAINPSIKQ
jgi:hypothetical protein